MVVPFVVIGTKALAAPSMDSVEIHPAIVVPDANRDLAIQLLSFQLPDLVKHPKPRSQAPSTSSASPVFQLCTQLCFQTAV